MDLSPGITIGVLIAMIVIGLVPRVPFIAKVALQLIIGAVIYHKFSDAMFNLPNGDNMKISSLMGGNGGLPEFNKLSMGVVSTAIGVIFSVIGAIVAKVLGGKKDDE